MTYTNKICAALAATTLLAYGAFWLGKNEGYFFYLARGASVQEVVQRYGPPIETHGSVAQDDLTMIYYSDHLNVVELKIRQGRVQLVDIRMAD